MYTHIHIHTHTYVYIYIYMYIYIYICMYVYIHVHTCSELHFEFLKWNVSYVQCKTITSPEKFLWQWTHEWATAPAWGKYHENTEAESHRRRLLCKENAMNQHRQHEGPKELPLQIRVQVLHLLRWFTHTHMYIYIYTHAYIRIYVYLCNKLYAHTLCLQCACTYAWSCKYPGKFRRNAFTILQPGSAMGCWQTSLSIVQNVVHPRVASWFIFETYIYHNYPKSFCQTTLKLKWLWGSTSILLSRYNFQSLPPPALPIVSPDPWR